MSGIKAGIMKKASRAFAGLALLALSTYVGAAVWTGAADLVPGAALAQIATGDGPSNVRGKDPSSEMWRAVRQGVTGYVSLPDRKAGILVQSEGDNMRAFRNGPMSTWGGWLLLASVVVLALFFALRGKIKIEAGPSGRTIERFNALDRFTHWLTASSFIILAVTGLNVLYGKYVLMPIIGQGAFATLTLWGKVAHNYLAFAFMLGILMMLVLWVRHNLPTMADLKWLAVGGGLFTKGTHPPAYKFNAGQKILFWLVILGGASLSFSGLCLLFPFELQLFAPTFKVLNVFGFSLPTALTPLQETQLSLLWHGVVALVMIAVVIGHIYIGTIGMEGALDAVTSGQVDENWAREHHPLWVAEVKGEAPAHR